MPIHDWTAVDAGIYHDFHTVWIGQIRSALNGGVLPEGYYALAEQHAGETIADVLTLHASREDPHHRGMPPPTGGTLVADAPPRVRRRQSVDRPRQIHPRTVAIRHVTGHQLVAMIEIVSPANKDRAAHVEAFVTKAVEALDAGVHLLIVDLFAPGRFDPQGMHGLIRQRLSGSQEPYDLPRDEPLTLASYSVGMRVEAYIEHLALGAKLIDMPLFLRTDRYINVPLEPTYQAAYQGVPSVWRSVLERAAGST